MAIINFVVSGHFDYHKWMSAPSAGKALPVSLIVLAGGTSQRMKQDKARLLVHNEPLIQKVLKQVEGFFDEVLLSVSKGQTFDFVSCPQVEDECEGQGPLAGILSGLKAAAHEVCVVAACDIPDIDMAFVVRMLDASEDCEIVVPSSAGGKLEPLLAVYKKSVIPKIEKLLASSNRQVLVLFDLCKTRVLKMGDSSWLRNLNTPEDYREYIQSLGRKK
jgi:molybdopterin-guanine dinucleotide biosynthesis protein A